MRVIWNSSFSFVNVMNIINLNLNANRSLTQQKVGGLLVMSIVGEAIIVPGLRNEMSKILNAVKVGFLSVIPSGSFIHSLGWR